MRQLRYNWDRFWVPRGSAFRFDQNGFVFPPSEDSFLRHLSHNEAKSFDKLLAVPCLVLLGEPGIGKSVSFRDAATMTRNSKPDARHLFVNLGAIGDESRLIADVFQVPEFIEWRLAGGELHLFLDSFDECLLRIDTLTAILAERFRQLRNVNGFHLRIASRPAEWLEALELALVEKWGKERVVVSNLAPLTQEQVEHAVGLNGIDGAKFVNMTVERDIVPFAIKPLTLGLLINVWTASRGQMPSNQREIYQKGCAELCSEANSLRSTPKLRKQSTAEERLCAAGMIAAATIFCNRSSLWVGDKASDKSTSDLSLSEIVGRTIKCGANKIEIAKNLLRETLDTGLFVGRGNERFAWSHQSYAEYLAAEFASQHLNSKQISDILFHPEDGRKKLIPQLHEVAAWIATKNNDLFVRISENQPDVLFRSDIATADEAVKSRLLDQLFKNVSNEEFRPDWWALRSRYRKLDHSGLQNRLRTVLLNSTAPASARVEAIEILEACELWGLLPELAKLALKRSEPHNVRVRTAEVISTKGDEAIKSKLRPLALGQKGPDPENKLRAAALRACWPARISATELFQHLEPKENGGTEYETFLSRHLVDGLSAGDLPVALRWAEAQPEYRGGYHDSYGGLVFQILERACDHLDDAAVLTAFAKSLLSRLRKHDFVSSLVSEKIRELTKENNPHRLKIAAAVLREVKEPSDDALHITRWGLPLLSANDIDWLITQLENEQSKTVRSALSECVRYVFYPSEVARVDQIIAAALQCSELRGALKHWLEPVDLCSETAQKARKLQKDEKEWTEKLSKTAQPMNPPPHVRIRAFLDRCEAGNVADWWHISFLSELEDTGHWADKSHQIDMRQLPGWKQAPDEIRSRILITATAFLNTTCPNIDHWFKKKNIEYRPAVAGIRALHLIMKEAPAIFSQLDDEVWKRWTPAILRRQAYDGTGEHRTLLEKAFSVDPQFATEWTLKCINQENRDGENLWVLQKLPNPYPRELTLALLSELKTGSLKPNCWLDLLSRLIAQKVDGALDHARSKIPTKIPKRKNRRLQILSICRQLMPHAVAADWTRIHRLIQQDDSFGKQFFEGMRFDFHHNVEPILVGLSEHDVSRLWEWTAKLYPKEEDPDRSRGGSVTSRWAMADFRDGLVYHLANKGTRSACAELDRLVQNYPQHSYLRQLAVRGKDVMRQKTWSPLSPDILLKLVEDRQNRWVQSSDQLQEVVLEALGELQSMLQGETPEAPLLWDSGRPKEEERLSDWVKNRLQDMLIKRGVILGREVQIRLKDRTDIHIDAISSAGEHLKVIVEVKGCWNPEIKTAMKTQLIDRYLNADCKHGIYLVGWYVCSSWATSDRRRKQVKFNSAPELRTFLERQARAECGSTRSVKTFVLDVSIPGAGSKKITNRERRKRKRSSN